MKPVLQALVLADKVYHDRQTGKKIIAGTFNAIVKGKIKVPVKELADGSKIPMMLGGISMGCPEAYISLTDVVKGTK